MSKIEVEDGQEARLREGLAKLPTELEPGAVATIAFGGVCAALLTALGLERTERLLLAAIDIVCADTEAFHRGGPDTYQQGYQALVPLFETDLGELAAEVADIAYLLLWQMDLTVEEARANLPGVLRQLTPS